MSLPLPAPIEIWRPNKSNSTTPHHTPCGFLVKNTKCLNSGCDFSHEAWRVRLWQNKHAAKPCRWGASCPHFRHGNCLYYHPPHHVQSEFNRDGVIKQDLLFVEHLDVDSLVAEKEVGICDKGDLASFNKISDDEIAVPGCPPRFHPITEPLSITLDWHNPNLTPSFAKYTHTFEPLLRSIEATDPDFDVFSTADIVSNASNLRKLFHLFSNKKNLKLTERFELEWRHNTLFLSKWTGDPSLRSSLGHGTGFEKETCRYAEDDHPALRNSSSHHRVGWYSFGGLDCVIQSEVDGYYCDCDHPRCVLDPVQTQAKKSAQQQQQQQQPVDINQKNGKKNRRKHRRKSSSASSSSTSSTSLSRSPPLTRPKSNSQTSQFSRFSDLLSLEDPGDTSQFIDYQEQAPVSPFRIPPPAGSIHEVISGRSGSMRVHFLPGRNIPSDCLIEVKTHKASNKPMFAPEAQLYFCRRTKLSVAQHESGVFRPSLPAADKKALPLDSGEKGSTENCDGNNNNGGVEDKTEDLARWEQDNQHALGKVAAFLRLLTGKMKDRAEGKMSGRISPGLGTGTGKEATVRGISIVVESDGKGKVKAGMYRRCKNEEDVKSLLPEDV